RPDECRRVLVQPDPQGERVVAQRRKQPAQPVPLAEVLVDDDPVREPQPRRECHDPGPRRRDLLADRDQVLAQERRALRGARDAPVRAAQRREPPEDRDVADLLFRTAHRDDVAMAIRHRRPPSGSTAGAPAAGPAILPRCLRYTVAEGETGPGSTQARTRLEG